MAKSAKPQKAESSSHLSTKGLKRRRCATAAKTNGKRVSRANDAKSGDISPADGAVKAALNSATAVGSDQAAGNKGKKTARWTNRQRCLVFSARGISHRHRHLMTDIRTMLPHCKTESKMDKKDEKRLINEMCEMRNCNKCLFFEPRREHLYLWMTNVPHGPTVQFYVENVHSMSELRLTGNSLKGSRPLLVFDEGFQESAHLQLVRELLTQVFGTPYMHPKSQPFVDHVLVFGWLDGRVWLRNYQIVDESGALAEIGPRCALRPVKIFAGSFSGQVVWRDAQFVSPKSRARLLKMAYANKQTDRQQQRKYLKQKRVGVDETVAVDVTDDIFTPA